jgi:hypothetical protein
MIKTITTTNLFIIFPLRIEFRVSISLGFMQPKYKRSRPIPIIKTLSMFIRQNTSKIITWNYVINSVSFLIDLKTQHHNSKKKLFEVLISIVLKSI